MPKEIVRTDRVKLVGNYSLATKARPGTFLFVSGATPHDAQGNLVGREGSYTDRMRTQVRQVLTNLKTVIEEAGGTLDDVVKLTIFTTSMRDFFKSMDVQAQEFPELFGSDFVADPWTVTATASTLIEVSRLANTAQLVEIEAIAVIGE